MLLAAVVAGGCARNADDAEARPIAKSGAPVCSMLDATDLSTSFGEEFEQQKDLSDHSVCRFASMDGEISVSVGLRAVPSRASMAALVADTASVMNGEAATSLGDEIEGDEVLWTPGEDHGLHALVVRKGGQSLSIEMTGETVARSKEAIVELAGELAARMPSGPFDPGEAEAANCDSMDVQGVAAAVEAPVESVVVEPAVGMEGCQVLVEGGDLSVIVHPTTPAEAMVASDLESLGRRLEVNGEEFVSPAEPVAELSDPAVWVTEPGGQANGDLYVLGGGVLRRITVASPSMPAAEMRRVAIAVAGLASPTAEGTG